MIKRFVIAAIISPQPGGPAISTSCSTEDDCRVHRQDGSPPATVTAETAKTER
jgi:hypothetical protein